MSVNLYDILNVQHNCTSKDIKNSYRKLLKEFHPDQPTGNTEMFELIVHAYNILINTKTRNEYDKVFKVISQSDSNHFKFKDNSENFIKMQKNNVLSLTKEQAKKEYDDSFNIMDFKNKFNRSMLDKISSSESVNRYNDMKMAREQEDLENIYDNLFDGDPDNINMAKFNEAWDRTHKSHTELIEHKNEPDAYDVNNFNGNVNYGDINNYEELYIEDEFIGTSNYGSINFATNKNVKLTKEDIKGFNGATYTIDHNKIDPKYDKSLENKLKTREEETKKFTSREFNDYNTDPNCGGYGITSKIGINDEMSNILWENTDLKKKYDAFIEHYKKN
jgi:curved DNA-binding protein CbpA